VRKVFIATTGALVFVVLTVGLYLPKLGQVALKDAYEQYQRCPRPILDWAPSNRALPADPETLCFVAYMKRREEILWRYFFFQTLATRLIGFSFNAPFRQYPQAQGAVNLLL